MKNKEADIRIREFLASQKPNGSSDDHRFLIWGQKLKYDQVKALEKRLLNSSEELSIRLLLLGHYQEHNSIKNSSRLFEHTLWMITNRPRDYVSYYLLFGRLSSVFSKSMLNQIQDAWIAQVRRNSKDWRVLCNAGENLRYILPKKAMSLYKRSKKATSKYALPVRRLAQCYRVKAIRGPASERAKYARLAIKEADLAFTRDDALGERIGMLTEFTWVAINFGYLSKAKKWARRLLQMASRMSVVFWQQYAYIYLIRIDLAEQNIPAAKRKLKKLQKLHLKDPCHVATVQQSLQMTKDLLSSGERESAYNYLKLIMSITQDREKLRQLEVWAAAIDQGRSPRLKFKNLAASSRRK